MSTSPTEKKYDSVAIGVGLVVVINIVAVVAGLLLGNMVFGDYGGLLFAGFIGVSQLGWVIPAALLLFLQKRMATLKGLAIAAGITFLLNLTCYGVVMIGG